MPTEINRLGRTVWRWRTQIANWHTARVTNAAEGDPPQGGDGPRRRERIIDPWMGKIEEWVERSHAKIRADRAFEKLKALGYAGSERTVRRAVAEVKANHRRGRRRVYRPWIPEPGMWAQWDWGTGPVISSRRTNLYCPAKRTIPPKGPTLSRLKTPRTYQRRSQHREASR